MDAVHSAFSENLHVIVTQPEGVCGKDVRSQNSESVQIFDRGESAVLLLAVCDFLRGLAYVYVNLQAVFPGEFSGPENQFLACGVDGVDADLEYAAVIKPE